MTSLVLYNYFRSSTSYRTRIALNLKGLDYEYCAINLLKSEQRSTEYLKINPMGGVPTLLHGDKVIPDSTAIIEYIEEAFPQNPLLPQDLYLRARIREACQIITSGMHPMGNLKVHKYLESKWSYSQEQKNEWVQHWTRPGLEALETILEEFAGTYCFGESVTMADIFLIPQITTCQRFKVDTSEFTLLTKIFDNCLKLEAFKKAHPSRQIDTPEEFRSF